MAKVQNIEVRILGLATETNDKGYGCNFQQVETEDAHIFTGKKKDGSKYKYVTARVSIVHPKIKELFENINKQITKFKAKEKQSFEFAFDIEDKEITQTQNAHITNIFLTPSGELQNTTDNIATIALESLVIGLASTCLKKETKIAKIACEYIELNEDDKIKAEGNWIVKFFNKLQELVKEQVSVTNETVV